MKSGRGRWDCRALSEREVGPGEVVQREELDPVGQWRSRVVGDHRDPLTPVVVLRHGIVEPQHVTSATYSTRGVDHAIEEGRNLGLVEAVGDLGSSHEAILID